MGRVDAAKRRTGGERSIGGFPTPLALARVSALPMKGREKRATPSEALAREGHRSFSNLAASEVSTAIRAATPIST